VEGREITLHRKHNQNDGNTEISKMKQYKITLLKTSRMRSYKLIEAESAFEAFDKARLQYEQPFKSDENGGGYSVMIDNIEVEGE
jgi:hypothetical protein